MLRVGNLHRFFGLKSYELEDMAEGTRQPTLEEEINILQGLRDVKSYFNSRIDNCINRLEVLYGLYK